MSLWPYILLQDIWDSLQGTDIFIIVLVLRNPFLDCLNSGTSASGDWDAAKLVKLLVVFLNKQFAG